MARTQGYDDLVVSIKKGVWPIRTQEHAEALGEAFRVSDHVFLLLSVDDSASFKRVARVSAPPGKLDSNSTWQLACSVQILRLALLEYDDVAHLILPHTATPLPLAEDMSQIASEIGMAVTHLLWEREEVAIDEDAVDVAPEKWQGWEPLALPVGEGAPENAVIDLRGNAEERAARLIWTHGTGFIVGCDAKMFAECERRSLFGLPLEYEAAASFIHPGTPLLLYNISTQQLLGVFEATTPMAKMRSQTRGHQMPIAFPPTRFRFASELSQRFCQCLPQSSHAIFLDRTQCAE